MSPQRGPLCPADSSHGVLTDWPNDRWAYYCPDQSHDGPPQTRAFFTTTEAERGSITSPAAVPLPSPAVSR